MDRDASHPAAQLRLVQVLSGHEDRVWCCAWSPSGATLATCGGDKTVRLWTRVDGGANQATDTGDEAPQWACAATLEELHNRTIRTVAWSPCGRLLASASFDGSVGIWERNSRSGDWTCVATLEGHENEVKAAAWSPCGRYLATCGRDKTVWIWDRGNSDADFECAAVLQGHSADVKSVTWCPVDTSGDGPVVMSCSYDDSLRLWREQPGDDDWECMQVLPGAATAAKEAATQARKAAHGQDEEAIAMAAADAALRAAASSGGHAGSVWAAAWHPGGGQVVTVSDDKAIKRWTWAQNSDTARLVPGGEVVDAHDRSVYCVDWHPGGQLLVTGGGDDAVKVWRLTEGGEAPLACACSLPAAHISDVNSVRWHPGGRYLASCGDDGDVRVWAWDDGRETDAAMVEV